MLYHLLRKADQEYATQLHNIKKLSPYATSPLLEYDTGKTVWGYAPEGMKFALRISVLDDAISKLIEKALLSSLDREIKISDGEGFAYEVKVSTLDYGKMLDNAKSIRSFRVIFKSPTFFRKPIEPETADRRKNTTNHKKIYRYIPLPDTFLMFNNLRRLWNAFTGVMIERLRYTDWIRQGGIAIAGVSKINTHRVYEHVTSKKFSTGFTGEVYFSLPKDTYNKKMAEMTHTLLEFAQYSNVGGNRSAGFGMIEYHVADETPQASGIN